MLQLSRFQMQALRDGQRSDFIVELARHAERFSPKLTQQLGREQTLLVAESAVVRAEKIGFRLRGPTRLILELSFLFGSGFIDDPQTPWAGAILADSSKPLEINKAEALHATGLKTLQLISGDDNRAINRALVRLNDTVRSPYRNFLIDNPVASLRIIHPEKFEYLGEHSVNQLVASAHCEVTERLRLPLVPGGALVSCLTFAFGHRFYDDMQYPWIKRTLFSSRLSTPEHRCDALERKSLMWLRAVIAKGNVS